MRLKVDHSWVHIEAGYDNKVKIRFESPGSFYDDGGRSVEISFDPVEWANFKRAGDLINSQVQVQAEFERELNG